MNLTITLSNLDSAIRQLEEFSKKLEEFPKDVAYESADNVRYPNATPMVIHTDGENKIVNRGKGIAFMEFGAGYDADFTTIEFAGGGSLPSYPGVWSDDHAGTFLRHLYSGKPQETYRYNQPAQHKMQDEAERLRVDTEQKAKDYFQ